MTVTPEAGRRSEQFAKYLDLIQARLEAKSQGRYGPHHILLVAVDDYLPLAQDYDWPVGDQRARTLMATVALDFGRVVFVGVAGRLFLSYSLPLLPEEANAL